MSMNAQGQRQQSPAWGPIGGELPIRPAVQERRPIAQRRQIAGFSPSPTVLGTGVSGGCTLPLSHAFNSTSLEVQGGVKFEHAASGLSLSITSPGRFSDDVEEYGGKVTVNYRF
jgi:hypothetical protein